MKLKKNISLLQTSVMALVTGMMFSCTGDLEEKSEFTSDPIVINLVSAADADIMPIAGTRSLSEDEHPDRCVLVNKSGDKMHLSCVETPWPSEKAATRGTKVIATDITDIGVSASIYPSSSSYTSAGCGSYFYKESIIIGTPTKFYWPTSDYRMSFYAYYPYGNSAFTVQSAASATGHPTYAYTVPTAIGSQVDVMTASQTDIAGGSSSPVSLSFSHQCAAIKVRITNSTTAAITVNSVSIEGVEYTGTLCNGTWTLSGTKNSSSVNPFTLTCNTAVAASATADLTGTTNIFLMLPQTLTSSAKLKMVIDSEEYEAELSGSWQAGKTYTYSVTKEPEEILFIDLGLPSGTKWAKGNIVSDGNGGYKVGEETDYGAYFSWGNVTPHFSSNGSTFDDAYNWGTSNTGSPYAGSAGASISYTSRHKGRDYTANTTNDAARACLGGSWQVPTATQFQELYDNTDNEWTTISGVNGRKFMKKTDHSVYVFFPAAGYGGSTSLDSRGSHGGYWSSSLNSAYRGYLLYFYSSYVNTQNLNLRYYGFSVRAVQ